jgi:hypothetical protein
MVSHKKTCARRRVSAIDSQCSCRPKKTAKIAGPASLGALMIEANEAATFRGHKLAAWVARDGGVAVSFCLTCGRGVQVSANPAPNEIDMAGEALALNCAPRPLSYDGFGINGADAYRTRIATFTTGASEALRAEMGPLFAAAPALLALVKKYRSEAVAQGAADEDLTEIDDVLNAVKGA